MNYGQVNGVDVYNFPEGKEFFHMLFWMGEDYIAYIIESLLDGLKKQDTKTELVAIKCETKPEFENTVNQDTQKISSIKASFQIQLLVKDGLGQNWRLHGINIYRASNFQDETRIDYEFEISNAEKV